MLFLRRLPPRLGGRWSSQAVTQPASTESKYPQIRADLRTVHGSNKSRQLRAQKIVPGVYYGKDENRNIIKVPIQVDMIALSREIRKFGISFENTVYELLLNDEKHLVTPRQLQVDPGIDNFKY